MRMLRQRIALFIPATGFLLLWEWFVSGSQKRQFLFSSPSEIFSVAIAEITQGQIFQHVYLTSLETVLGLILGGAIGITVGLILWVNKAIGEIAKPYIVVIGSIPIFALAPMLVIWFGVGLLPKVIMAAFSVCIVSIVYSYNAAMRIDEEHNDWVFGLGLNRRETLRSVIFPSSIKIAFEGMRLNVGFALIGAFIGEFVSSDSGLGYYIIKASSLYDTSRVLFGVGLLMVIGLILTKGLSTLEESIPALKESK